MPGTEKKQFRGNVTRGLEKGKESIDRKNKVIRGVSVISVGEALGHGVMIDETTVDQVIEQGNSHGDKGIKSRFGHPNMSAPAVGSALGRLKDFRPSNIKKYRAIADLYFGDYAFKSPNGNIAGYTFDVAEEDPDQFGASIVFEMEEEFVLNEDGTRKKDEDGEYLNPLARVKTLHAGDVVDEAATGDGLFEKFFSKTVMPSAEVTKFLDKYLKEPDALEGVLGFLKKYQENDLYKDKRKQLKEIENIVKETISTNNLKKEQDMPKENVTNTTEDTNKIQFGEGQSKIDAAREKELKEHAAKLERDRIETIQALGVKFNIKDEVINEMIKKGTSLEDACKELSAINLDEMSKPVKPADIKVNIDGTDNFRTGVTNALLVRTQIEKDKKVIANVKKSEFTNMGMQMCAKECLSKNGDPLAFKYSGEQLWDKIFNVGFATAPTQGSGDFVNVMSNVLNKSLLTNYEFAPATFEDWVKTGTLADFKTADLVRLSEMGDVERMYEGEAPKEAKMSDYKEQTRLQTWGQKFIISREAMVNDDLAQITTVPAKQARALKRKMNAQCYGLLYDGNGANSAFQGPTMNEDTKTLFDAANHTNYATTGALTTTILNVAFTSMRRQVSQSPDADRSATIKLNLQPRYLIVGPQDEVAAYNIFDSLAYNISGNSTDSMYRAGQRRWLKTIVDAELEGLSTDYYPYYLACDPLDVDTVTLYTLNGNTNPFTDSANLPVGDASGFVWMIRHDFRFAAPDYRGLYCVRGTAK